MQYAAIFTLLESDLILFQSRASIDTLSSDSERAPVFSQAISEAFEPYLSVWVEAQDK